MQGLTGELQRVIFIQIFPTKRRIRARFEQQQPCPPEFASLDLAIVDFLHTDHEDLELADLTPREKRWVYFRGQLFGLHHFSYLGQSSRIMVLLKTAGWYYNDEKWLAPKRWDRISLERQVYWCEECGLEQDGHPIYRKRNTICHGCYGHLLRMGEADENGWMEELSFGMVGF